MRGCKVVVERQVTAGSDPHGNPTFGIERETVENVLAMPGVAADDAEAVRPFGVEVSATLAFPKTYAKCLRNAKVYVHDFKRWFRVVGDPLPTPPDKCPTAWNYKVWITADERYQAE